MGHRSLLYQNCLFTRLASGKKPTLCVHACINKIPAQIQARFMACVLLAQVKYGYQYAYINTHNPSPSSFLCSFYILIL